MAEQLMTASQVKERFGYERADLLRWEAERKIHPKRTTGGQRRYSETELSGLGSANIARKEPSYTEMGVTGVRRWGGAVYEERLPELRGRPGQILYREMKKNDPVIAAVFFAIENTLRQAQWRVKPFSESEADKEVAEFVEQCLHDMTWSWADTMTFILEFLTQGFSVLEVVYKRRLGPNPPDYTRNPATSQYSDGRVGWRKWAPRPAESLADGDEWVFDDRGGIKGINQQPETMDAKAKFIPIDKLLLFRTTCAPANAPEAPPIHRSMYLPYYFTRNLQEVEGIGIERDLAGIPVLYMGNDTNKNENDANSDISMGKDMVVNLRNDEQSGVVIPYAKMGEGAEVGMGMRLELLSAAGSRPHNISEIVERYDKRKALGVLAQFIMLGLERVGSFALSKHQGDLFSISVQGWLTNVADVINRYAIPKLMQFNSFPGTTGYPQLVPSDVRMPDLQEMGFYINALAGKNLIDSDNELKRHLRQLARLPEPTGEQMPAYGGSVDDTAMLLRRLLSSLEQVQTMGTEGGEELTAAIQELIRELQQKLGTGTATAPDIPTMREQAESASQRGWGNNGSTPAPSTKTAKG